MKKIFYFFLLVGLSICTSSITNAQTINFQDTKGETMVDASGSATYKLPIALPPGIKNVAPQLSITYSSSSNNGIAGYGWNLTGISSINRTATRLDLDGYIDAVDFDSNDQFLLDGQRLINLGNNIFGTENFSNMKIIANGSPENPDSFTINFPDGSIAYYGNNTDAKGISEYQITKWVDSNGNYVKYEYIKDGNVIYPSKIIWSGNDNKATGYQNSIDFFYDPRIRPESGYLYGNKLTTNKILSRITVTTGNSIFKTYQFSHIKNELNYQFVERIQELNGANEAANPVIFKYNFSSTGFSDNFDYYKSNGSFYLDKVEHSGDFDGNGQIDFIVKESGYKMFLNKIDNNDNWISIPVGASIPPINTLFDNKLLQRQSLVYKTNNTDYGSYSNHSLPTNHQLYLKPQVLNTSTNQLSDNYTRTISYPYLNYIINSDGCMNRPLDQIEMYTGTPTTRFITGDFNGDGISDYILLGQYSVENIYVDLDWNNGGALRPEPGCNPHYSKHSISPYYIDMNPLLLDSEASFRVNGSAMLYEDEQFILDFNGDGKDDIININDYGYYNVYTFKNSQEIEKLASGHIPEYNKKDDPKKQLVWGDYNGDGKTDFLVPVANKSSDWMMYVAKGNEFEKISYTNFHPYEPEWGPGAPFDRRVKIRSYRAVDLNNDGKSDLLENEYESYCVTVAVGDCDRNARGHFRFRANMGVDSNGKVVFGAEEYKQIYSQYGYNDAIHLLTGNFNNSNNIIFIQGDQIWKGNFKKDISQDKLITSIKEAGESIETNIQYANLKPNSSNNGLGSVAGVYFSTNSESFPFTEIKQLPDVKVVSRLSVTINNKQKYREFKYSDLTSHSKGLGILGFKLFAQTGWIVDGINEYTPIWQVASFDPKKRNVNISNWSFSGNTNLNLITNPIDNNLISKNISTYSYNILTSQNSNSPSRFALLLTKDETYDFVLGTKKTTDNFYDNYKNISNQTITVTGNGSSFIESITNTYSHNTTGTGNNFFIGRLIKEVSKVDAYGGSYTTQKEYTYTNNNISKTKATVQNDGEQIIDYTYDTFGNVIKIIDYGKKINSIIENPSGGIGISYPPREINNTYDANGRFVIKKKDTEGYETLIEYNLLGQVTKETDKFGATTSTEYDKWGKLLKVTLSNSSTAPIITQYQYFRDTTGWNIVSFSDQTRAYSTQYFDAVGNNIKNTIKGFSNGQYISNSTEYDFLGRKLRESQPYFSSPSQWRTYEYDYLLRPTKITNHTGLVVTNSYNGLTVTTVEGARSKKITKDAIGNTAQLIDNGTETIKYTYFPHGGVKTTTYGSHVITTNYDVWGRRTSLFDPSVSSTPYTYSYTIYDEIKEEKMPEGTTTYKYDGTGKILERTTTGKSNISVNYTYDPSKKGLLVKEYGNNESNSFSNDISYDNYFRITGKNEVTPKFVFGKQFVYDEFGRIMNSESWTMTNNKRVQTVILNHQYNQYNGELNLLLDISKGVGKVVWKANAKNERGQLLNSTLGELISVENIYDTYGNITNIRNKKGNDWLYNVDYQYQVDHGLLTKRTDSHFGWEENFTYDNFDRLLTWSSPNGTNSNTYLSDGRINKNSQVGEYSYLPNEKYKKKSLGLNAQGGTYYSVRKLQDITYDAFKRPLNISEEGRGLADFQYGINGARFYAKKQDLLANKIIEKYYSHDGSMDISIDINGNAKIINYISSPYDTPFIYVTELNSALTTTNEGFYYLARDFQSSIMAIYDTNAAVIERRLFDPWGNIVKVQDAGGNVKEGENAKLIFLDHGYTGHEHFTEVGIIHMNGRIYDPILKQFLSPDNFIQDPDNSQNYNRYGYAWNNPLKYCDPSGEELIIAGSATIGAMVIGAIIGGAVYTGLALYNGYFSWGGLIKSMGVGAASGAIASGIGELTAVLKPAAETASFFTKSAAFMGKMAVESSMHAVSQGFIAGITGGNIEQSLLSGAVSSVVSSIVNVSGAEMLGSSDAAIILFGTVSGGVAARLTGGNFWEGAAVGLVVSGLNHAMHNDNDIFESEDSSEGPGKGNGKNDRKDGKGNKFRGGKQKQRDGDLSKYPKEFKDWYHKNAKHYKLPGQPDPNLDEPYGDWVDLGKPKAYSAPQVNSKVILGTAATVGSGYILIKAVDYIGGRVSFLMTLGISSTLMTMPYTNTAPQNNYN